MENVSFIKTNSQLVIYIEEDVYFINENDSKYNKILQHLKEKNLCVIKALLNPLKYGLIATDEGIGIILEYTKDPLKIKILIKNKIIYKNSL